jgi:tetratricopeptide (TPR) repeat protein
MPVIYVSLKKTLFKFRGAVACTLLVMVTIAIYQQVFTYEFISLDDNLYVYENRHVLDGLSAENVRWAFANRLSGMWIPITWLSLMIDSTVFGTSPAGYHFTNVIIHLINIVLLFSMLMKLTGDFWPSVLVASLFAFHPVHVESVAWVTERKDVLSAFFFFLTVMSYSHYSQKRTLRPLWYLVTYLFFVLGLMAKPMLITMPFILILLDFWPLKRIEKGAFFTRRRLPLFIEKIPFLVFAISVSVVTYLAVQHDGGIISLESSPMAVRATNALVSYVKYFGKLFYPAGLAVLYPHPHTISWLKILSAFGLLSGISWIMLRHMEKAPYFIVGWLWYLGMLLPVIGLVHAGPQAMADRYVYLPFIGLYIAIAWGISAFLQHRAYRKVYLCVLATILFCVLTAKTWNQIQYWQNSITLFTHTLKHTSNNAVIHNNLGYVLYRKGLFEKAIFHFYEALRIRPLHEGARNHLGLALVQTGRVDEAIAQYQDVLKRNADNYQVHNNLGIALKRKGLIRDALMHYQAALRIKPDYIAAHIGIGNIYAGQRNLSKAIHHFLSALKMDPTNATLHNHLGVAFFLDDQKDRARNHFEQAIINKPNFVNARINLGNLLVNTEKYDQAIDQYQRARRIKPDDPAVNYYLGIAYLLSDKKDLAKEYLRTALRVDPDFNIAHYPWKTTVNIPDDVVHDLNTLMALSKAVAQ